MNASLGAAPNITPVRRLALLSVGVTAALLASCGESDETPLDVELEADISVAMHVEPDTSMYFEGDTVT